MSIGALIKTHRVRLGISQQDLAERLKSRGFDFRRGRISSWEREEPRNEFEWNPDFLDALAEALEVSPLQLLDEMGFPTGLPSGISPEALAIAQAISSAAPDLRTRLLRMVNAALE
jgi:transcriptional regulator with XRE-family HTH domain